MIRHVQGSVEVTRLWNGLPLADQSSNLNEEEMAAIKQRADTRKALRLNISGHCRRIIAVYH